MITMNSLGIYRDVEDLIEDTIDRLHNSDPCRHFQCCQNKPTTDAFHRLL